MIMSRLRRKASASSAPDRQLHVAHLTSVHPVFDIRIFHKECQSLRKAGYRVSLVAVHDHDEVREGVEVIAVPATSSRWTRMLLTPLRVFAKALKLQADVYHFHDPELIPIGLLLRAMGKRVVYDVHEDVPLDLLQKVYLPRLVAAPLSRAARTVHSISERVLSEIVVVTPGVAEPFRSPVMIRNFPLLEEFAEPGPPYQDRPETAVFIGGISRLRGSQAMWQATHIAARQSGIRLVLAGTMRDSKLESALGQDGSDGAVSHVGTLDREGIRDLLDSTRIGLFLSQPEYLPLYAAYPNKVFEYMAAGIPVVASDFPVLREIVGESECGLLVDSSNPDAIAEAMTWLLDHPVEAEAMGRRGRQAVLDNYNFSGEATKLDQLYRRLCA